VRVDGLDRCSSISRAGLLQRSRISVPWTGPPGDRGAVVRAETGTWSLPRMAGAHRDEPDAALAWLTAVAMRRGCGESASRAVRLVRVAWVSGDPRSLTGKASERAVGRRRACLPTEAMCAWKRTRRPRADENGVTTDRVDEPCLGAGENLQAACPAVSAATRSSVRAWPAGDTSRKKEKLGEAPPCRPRPGQGPPVAR